MKRSPHFSTPDIEDCVQRESLTDEAVALRSQLLEWWDRPGVRRSMPWRREPPASLEEKQQWAYGVWVSEVMLQQTQYDRVVDYWRNWMAKWPTVEALAEASLEDVQAAWTGLGYYRRAGYLLEGAKDMKDIPTTYDGWKEVKGVGAYTAAAVSSVCFDERVPVVDGNVKRVLSRLCGLKEVSDKTAWTLAGQLVDSTCDRPGDMNQALMELGATVCLKAGTPNCDACPWRSNCVVSGQSLSFSEYPMPKKRKASKSIDISLLLVQRQPDARFALVQQSKSLLAQPGMWHLPFSHQIDTFSSSGDTRLLRVTKKPLSHTITNKKYSVHVDFVLIPGPHSTTTTSELRHDASQEVAWLHEDELNTKGSSSIVKKALAVVKRDCSAFLHR